jgi:hypothetical protein
MLAAYAACTEVGPRTQILEAPPRGQHSIRYESQHYFLTFAGMVPTLGREIGGSAAMFATYELTKRKFAQAQVHPIAISQFQADGSVNVYMVWWNCV